MKNWVHRGISPKICKVDKGDREMRLYWFSVEGSGDFPFRLLFESKCWPVDEREAHKIALACPTVAPKQTINFASYKKPSRLDYDSWLAEKWPIMGGGEIS